MIKLLIHNGILGHYPNNWTINKIGHPPRDFPLWGCEERYTACWRSYSFSDNLSLLGMWRLFRESNQSDCAKSIKYVKLKPTWMPPETNMNSRDKMLFVHTCYNTSTVKSCSSRPGQVSLRWTVARIEEDNFHSRRRFCKFLKHL